MTGEGSPRLYIFDADGTLRWTTVEGQRYPLASHEWRLMPGVRERLSSIPWASGGPWLAVASNQTGVGEGELPAETARALIEDAIVSAVGTLPAGTRIEMCCCSADIACRRRKPHAGMILALLNHFGVAATDALFVGDLPIDEQAAIEAGVPFMWAHAFFG